MKKLKISSICALALLVASPAMAGDWEIWTGSFGGVDLTLAPSPSRTTINFATGNGVFGANPTVAYTVADSFQILLNPALHSSDATGTSTTNFNLYGGVIFNFMGNMDEAMFFKAAGGYVSQGGATTTGAFAWYASLGKRFKIVDHVTYAPEVLFNMMHFASTASALRIVPVQFTMMF